MAVVAVMKTLPLTLMTWMGDDRVVFRGHGDKRRVSIVGGVTDVRPLALGSNKAGRNLGRTGPPPPVSLKHFTS